MLRRDERTKRIRSRIKIIHAVKNLWCKLMKNVDHE